MLQSHLNHQSAAAEIKRPVQLGKHSVGLNCPTLVIAEIGATHAGNIAQALALIDAAAECGANAVKLQTVDPDYSYTRQSESYKIFSTLKFDFESVIKLKRHADDLGLTLFTTPGDFPSLKLAIDAGFEIIKISSGLSTNSPLVQAAAQTNRSMIISTGMAYLDEVGRAVRVAREAGAKNIAVLHCTSIYPLPDGHVNLRAISAMSDALGVPAGYSDHTPDGLASVAAVAAGANIIEKHLALSHDLAGPERGVACEPAVFRSMVTDIRRVEQMLGTGQKGPVAAEIEHRRLFRRSIIARRSISKGQRIERDDIGLMRGSGRLGLAPELYESVLGMRATRHIDIDEPILIGCLEEVAES